jgi:hypothetical protein
MAGVTAIQGVDDTLKQLVSTAVAGLSPKPAVTVGPLDRDDQALRLNWFLYRISPNVSYRNMEPPQAGWRTSRGNPPLALSLEYHHTAFPATATDGGDQEQFAHAGLAAAMRALHANAIIDENDPALSPLAGPLVEPLRISMEPLDLDALTKLWTSTTEPLRLSVGYQVGLVIIDAVEEHVAGPPVRTRRVAVVPSLGPRLVAVDPARGSFGDELLVEVQGMTAGTTFTLARERDDPAGPDGAWPMTLVTAPPPPSGHVRLSLPRDDLAPGARRLDVSASEGGLPVGRDSIGLTVAPVVTGPTTPLAKGVPVALATAHAAPDVEVFLGGVRLDPATVTFGSPTTVTVTIPSATPAGPAEVALRARKVAGPPATIEVAP